MQESLLRNPAHCRLSNEFGIEPSFVVYFGRYVHDNFGDFQKRYTATFAAEEIEVADKLPSSGEH